MSHYMVTDLFLFFFCFLFFFPWYEGYVASGINPVFRLCVCVCVCVGGGGGGEDGWVE